MVEKKYKDKAALVADLNDKLTRASAVVVTEYRGLKAGEMIKLRNSLRDARIEVFVVKNSLLRRAAAGTNSEAIAEGLAGPTAIALSYGEPAEAAMRGFPGVRREVIHAHEEMGEKMFFISAALGVLSIGALAKWRRVAIPRGAAVALLLATAFTFGGMAYTALLGGRVRHTEVRPGALPADAITIEPRRAPGPRPPE